MFEFIILIFVVVSWRWLWVHHIRYLFVCLMFFIWYVALRLFSYQAKETYWQSPPFFSWKERVWSFFHKLRQFKVRKAHTTLYLLISSYFSLCEKNFHALVSELQKIAFHGSDAQGNDKVLGYQSGHSFYHAIVELLCDLSKWLVKNKIWRHIKIVHSPEHFDCKKFLTDFSGNLAIALVLFLLLFLVRTYHYHWPLRIVEEELKAIEDKDMDWVMSFRSSWPPDGGKKIFGSKNGATIPGFVFLDIDQETYKAWGELLFTPRDCLQKLITVATESNAKVVVVDVDLRHSIPVETSPCASPKEKPNNGDIDIHKSDNDLHEFLKKYAEKCEKKQSCTPIILARSFEAKGSKLVKLPRSFLDDVVTPKSAPYVQLASVAFVPTEQVLRYWWLWQSACREQQPMVIPSVELAISAMLCHENPKTGYDAIMEEFQQHNLIPKAEQCHVDVEKRPISGGSDKEVSHSTTNNHGEKVPTFTIPICGELKVNGRGGPETDIGQRIRYSMKEKQLGDDILMVLSAKEFTAFDSRVSGESLRGKIVVIGSSYSAAGDIHETPLGKMSGAMVLINAINSLLEHGEMSHVSTELSLILTIGFIFLMSVFFTLSPSFDAKLIVGVIILIGGIIISTWSLGSGKWLNFVLALLTAELHHLINEIRDKEKEVEECKLSSSSKREINIG